MAKEWIIGVLILLVLLPLAHTQNKCGDGECEEKERDACFADCAGSWKKFECPFDEKDGKNTKLDPTGAAVGDDTVGALLTSQMQWALPGLEHISKGFNSITGEETPHPVVNLLYCGGNPDSNYKLNYVFRGNTYRIPLGLHVVTSPKCSLDASTQIHSFTHGFSQSMASEYDMSVSASANGGGLFVKAAASAAFSKSRAVEQAKELMSSGSTSLAVTTVKCLSFKFEWADSLDGQFGFNYLHPDFERDLNGMETPADAYELVQKYGTHFYKKGHLGGKLETLTSVTDSLVSEKGSQSVANKLSASVSASVSAGFGVLSGGLSAEGSFSQSGQVETTSDDEISNNTESSSIRSYGGAPFDPSSSTFGEWASSVDALPVPVDFELAEILSILPDVKNRHGVNIRDYWRDAIVAYFSSQGVTYATKFKAILYLPNTENQPAYGPYGYNLFSPDGLPLMARPALFTIPGTSVPHLFMDSGFVLESIIPLEQTTLKEIAYIEIYSIEEYFRQLGLSAYTQQILATNPYPNKRVQAVNLWQLANMSIFDLTSGEEHYFTRFEINAKFKPGQSSEWTADKGILYRAERSFYEIHLILALKWPTDFDHPNPCYQPPITGINLFNVKIFGSKKTLTLTLSTTPPPTFHGISAQPYLIWRVDSVEDVGVISRVEVSALYTSQPFCVPVTQVKVVDINGRVYFTRNYDPPFKFQMIQSGSDLLFLRGLEDQYWGVQDSIFPPESYSTLVAGVSPYSDVTTTEILYAYQLAGAETKYLYQSSSACNSMGGALASSFNLQQIQDLKKSFCTKSIWQDFTIEGGTSWTCYNLVPPDNECPAGTPVGYTKSPGQPTSSCLPLCVGPVPTEALLASKGYSIVGEPVPLQIQFAGVTVQDENYQMGDNDTSLSAAEEYEEEEEENGGNDSSSSDSPPYSPVGYIHYVIEEVNSGYIRLSISNSTATIASAAFFSADFTGINGVWSPLNTVNYPPYWTGTGSVSFPLKISLTSASGQTVFDTLPYDVNELIVGNVQFSN